MAESRRMGWRRLKVGCFGLGALAIVVLIVIGGMTGFAFLQNRSEAPERREVDYAIPGSAQSGEIGFQPRADAVPGRIVLDLSVCVAVIVPAPPGTPIQVQADYDPGHFELQEESTGNAETGWTYRITMRPTGSASWALFRAKIGGRTGKLRISLPRDVRIELNGEADRGYVAMELGGLWLRSTDLDVKGGAVKLSFAEPLREPMERMEIRGSTGAIEVTQLGNASPRSVVFQQHLGAVDLDLRGPWSRDAEIRIHAPMAGGTLWLPDGVAITGIEGRTDRFRSTPAAAEVPPPTLDFRLANRTGKIIIID